MRCRCLPGGRCLQSGMCESLDSRLTTYDRVQVSNAKAQRCKERKGTTCFVLLCALCNLASLRWKLIQVVDLSNY